MKILNFCCCLSLSKKKSHGFPEATVDSMKYDGWWYCFTKAEKSRAVEAEGPKNKNLFYFSASYWKFYLVQSTTGLPRARFRVEAGRGRSQLAKGNGFAVAFITRSKAFQFVWINNLLPRPQEQTLRFALPCTHHSSATTVQQPYRTLEAATDDIGHKTSKLCIKSAIERGHCSYRVKKATQMKYIN